MRFNNNDVSDCNTYKPTKRELKNQLFRAEKMVKEYKKDMKTFSKMLNTYNYNQNHLRGLVGECYIALSNSKANKKDIIKKIKDFK